MSKKKYVQVGIGSRARMFYEALASEYKQTCEIAGFCDISQIRMDYANKIGHGPTPEETNFVHCPANKFCGVQINPVTKRLIPTAFNVVDTFEKNAKPNRWLYISETGDDKNPGTFEEPMRTLTNAMQQVKPGTAIRIMPGEYTDHEFMGERFENVYGTAENPIWIGGVPGMERPVLSMITIAKGAYVIIHDLEIFGPNDKLWHGIHVNEDGSINPEAAHHFVIRGNYVHDVTNSPFKIAGLYHSWYFDNEIGSGNPMRQSGDIDHVGAHYINAAYNYIWDAVGTGISFKGGSANSNIYGNLIINGGHAGSHMGQSSGREFFRPAFEAGVTTEAYNIRTYANIFIGGITPVVFSSSRDNFAINNTFILPECFILRILNQNKDPDWYMGGAASNGTIANNIFVFDNWPETPFNIGPGTAPETFTFKNNLFFNIHNPGVFPKLHMYINDVCEELDKPLSGMDLNSTILQDPLFVNNEAILHAAALTKKDAASEDERRTRLARIAAKDLVLSKNSPAKNTGVHFDFVTLDFFGKPFKTDGRSIGALQFI